MMYLHRDKKPKFEKVIENLHFFFLKNISKNYLCISFCLSIFIPLKGTIFAYRLKIKYDLELFRLFF